MNFQSMIAILHQFWGDRGCLIAQPYDIETGAGTKNPHTFLRAIGPEPGQLPMLNLAAAPRM